MGESVMYKLYWAPGGANMVVHAALREIGAAVEMIRVDLEQGGQHDASYLRLNPHGRVPTLIYDNDRVIYESAAIAMFLAERHPDADLAPRPGHSDRGPYLQWMAYLTNTLQEALMHWWHADTYVDGLAEQANMKARAEHRLASMAGFLDAHLAAQGPNLCGARFYICDYFLAMLVRWSRSMPQPLQQWPQIRGLVDRSMQRPAYRQMLQEEGITQDQA
ncbi:MAG TPA: glutathione S-transferase family protein [Terriglobales bacterium]|nr:glutathione S-transferase family protein [Terriglobales bacterium]